MAEKILKMIHVWVPRQKCMKISEKSVDWPSVKYSCWIYRNWKKECVRQILTCKKCEQNWCLKSDHSALSVKRFQAKYNIPVLDRPPYPPDLAPCNFYLFSKVKSALKGTIFESVKAVKERTGRILKEMAEKEFQHYFEQWKIRMDRRGVYIESDNKQINNI